MPQRLWQTASRIGHWRPRTRWDPACPPTSRTTACQKSGFAHLPSHIWHAGVPELDGSALPPHFSDTGVPEIEGIRFAPSLLGRRRQNTPVIAAHPAAVRAVAPIEVDHTLPRGVPRPHHESGHLRLRVLRRSLTGPEADPPTHGSRDVFSARAGGRAPRRRKQSGTGSGRQTQRSSRRPARWSTRPTWGDRDRTARRRHPGVAPRIGHCRRRHRT